MERRQLRRVRIGDIPCVEHLGRARDFGERGADEPAGATFGERDAAARGLIGVDHATRGLDEFRSEEHTSELQSLMRNSYAVCCLNITSQYEIHNTSHTVTQIIRHQHSCY